ncbi:FitA-like ribbon-helix-helix domain-containing protein [Geomonas propionica]|uniref:FitA-like ribbon-helix-helix domain-containing protein n=1 Tax=Geomonas propionica TaxID=2798582 RepID=UPI0038B2C6F2
MASITIRNLDNSLKNQLRVRAARHGRSMEAEARSILAETLNPQPVEENLALAIHRRFASLELDGLPIPDRQTVRSAPDFE